MSQVRRQRLLSVTKPGPRVVLVRHGRTSWNAASRFQGQANTPLDDMGQQQALRVAERLHILAPDALVSSDLDRAVATATPLAQELGLPVSQDERFRETYGALWEGLTHAEIESGWPGAFEQWKVDPLFRSGIEGETRVEVAERMRAGILANLAALPETGTLVVVTHGGAARAAVGIMLGLPRDYWGTLGGLANGSWSILDEEDDAWRLTEHNANAVPEPVMGEEQ